MKPEQKAKENEELLDQLLRAQDTGDNGSGPEAEQARIDFPKLKRRVLAKMK